MEKQRLREQAILEREQLSKSLFWKLNDQLLKNLIAFDWSKTSTLHLFLPIVERKEVDTFEVIHFFKSKYPDTKLVVPRCNFKTKQMDSIAFDPDSTVLVKNKQHIPEPLYGEQVEPTAIDAVIIPLLVFDQLGHRVGYGGGFYDRFLEKCRPDVLKVGVSLFKPIDKILDTNHQDIQLSHCITPEQVFFFG